MCSSDKIGTSSILIGNTATLEVRAHQKGKKNNTRSYMKEQVTLWVLVCFLPVTERDELAPKAGQHKSPELDTARI